MSLVYNFDKQGGMSQLASMTSYLDLNQNWSNAGLPMQ